MNAKELLLKQLEERNSDLSKLEDALKAMEIEEERAKAGHAITNLKAEIEGITNALNEEARKEADTAKMVSTEKGDVNKMDYRTAFKDYVMRGMAIPAEFRADATTKTTDVSVAIPQNLVDRIFESFEDYGEIYNLVTKTNYPVGQTIPKDGIKPTASWVAEGATSDKQKKTLNGSFTFSHFKLRCEIAITEETSVMTIDAFEALFVKQVSEAMVKAIEGSIVSGDGTTQPTGILTLEGVSTVEVANTGITYADLVAMEAEVRADKEGTAKWFMSKKTFMAILGMTDTAGQPIARVNYGIGGKPERYLLGREVVLYTPQDGSKLTTYSASSAEGDIVAFIADMSDYVLNVNYNLGVQSRVNWDTEDHETKAVMACDGKWIEDNSTVVEMVVKTA